MQQGKVIERFLADLGERSLLKLKAGYIKLDNWIEMLKNCRHIREFTPDTIQPQTLCTLGIFLPSTACCVLHIDLESQRRLLSGQER